MSHLYKSGNSGKYRLKIWGDVDEPKKVTRNVIDYVDAALEWGLVGESMPTYDVLAAHPTGNYQRKAKST